MGNPKCVKHNSYWTAAYGTCMACRAEKAEAELAQAKADREVLAAWVRKALKQDDPDGLPFAGDDVHKALSRAGGK